MGVSHWLIPFAWLWFPFHRLQGCPSSCFWCLPLRGGGGSKGLVQASWWERLLPAHWWVELCQGVAVQRWLWAQMGLCSYQLFGLRCPSTGPTGCWVGLGQHGDCLGSSHLWVLSSTSASSYLWPHSDLIPPQRPSETSREVWPRLLGSHCFFPGLRVHKTLSASPGVEFVSLLLVECSDPNPAGLQSHMLWGLLLRPQAGELGVGLHTLTPVGEPLRYNHLPVGGSLAW